MRYTKICVFDASAERKSIRKFNEAFLSGCVVASDIPSEMEDQVFKDAVIELHQGMTEEDINDVLQEALQDLDNLQRMAVKAFKLARQHFSCKHKVDRLLEVVARYKRGEVGYWFPYGNNSQCI